MTRDEDGGESDGEREHLAPNPDRPSLRQFRALLDRAPTAGHKAQLLRSAACPQPYDRRSETRAEWEGGLIVASALVDPDDPDADPSDGYELREEGTDSDAGRWLRCTHRIPRLDQVS